MTVHRFTSPGLHDGGFAHGAEVSAGSLVYTAGLSPLDDDGRIVGADDPVAQTVRAIECLDILLGDHASLRSALIKVTVYVATSDAEVLGTIWRTADATFAGHTPPAIVVGVTALPYPGQVVEIEAVFAKDQP
ncbi:MAG: RidA family protein [Gordonia sp. (in: high G+C Gram-positive bacteria)]